MAERAALYARSATGQNLQDQLDNCRRYAQERSYQIVLELAEAASGITVGRPGLNQVKELAIDGALDVLVVLTIDRLARDVENLYAIEAQLREAGVRIECVSGSSENDLIKSIREIAVGG
jgi:DNA invertase Pin-like site-specific DNA recombinase